MSRLISIVFLLVLVMGCFGIMESKALTIKRVPDSFSESNAYIWNNIEHKVLTTTDKNIVFSHWKGVGGDCDIGEKFIQVIQLAKSQGKHVKFIVYKYAMSMMADVLCRNPNYSMLPNSVIVLHNATIVSLHRYDDSLTYQFLDQCRSVGMVTNKEIHTIIYHRKQLWIYDDGSRRYYPDEINN